MAENIICHCGRWYHARCGRQAGGTAHQWALGYYLRLLPREQMMGPMIESEFLKAEDSYS